MTKNLLLTLSILLSNIAFPQNNSLSEKAKVSILTCGLGPESYAMYGHTGIRIKDDLKGIDIVYNYGTFDFNTPNFIGKFIKGDLQYFVTFGNFMDFYYNYQFENREIIEQELNLTSKQIHDLYQQLNHSVFSEERFYTYKFIDRNCTTMVVDKINDILGKEYIKSKTTNQSYREILYPYMTNFYMKLGIQLIFGTKVDEPATRLFLPYELKNVISETKINGNSIEKNKAVILKVTTSKLTFNWLNSIYSLISILIILVLLKKKWIQISYFILVGILGLFFSLIGFFSLHQEVLWNYNILLFNPLLLIFSWYLKKENSIRIVQFGKLILIFLLLYLAYMTTKIHFKIVWPFIILHLYWFSKIIIKYKKQIKGNTVSQKKRAFFSSISFLF